MLAKAKALIRHCESVCLLGLGIDLLSLTETDSRHQAAATAFELGETLSEVRDEAQRMRTSSRSPVSLV